jgi:hypothetical protein
MKRSANPVNRRRFAPAVFLCALVCCLLPDSIFAGIAPGERASKRLLLHGLVRGALSSMTEGEHAFHVRLIAPDRALVHDEALKATVQNGSFDLVLGTQKTLTNRLTSGYSIGLSVDGGPEIAADEYFTLRMLLSEEKFGSIMRAMDASTMPALDPNYSLTTSQAAERLAMKRGLLRDPHYSMRTILAPFSHLAGLQMEMALASPSVPTMDYYQMAKYGRINVEYNNVGKFQDANFGVAAQAMHVAHHLLLYAAGFTTDVNGDGMFMLTMGAAHYQTGNKRWEKFVNAPFIRLKYHSSPGKIFAYSEVETTMHERQYVSGTFGMGLRVAQGVKLIGGLHHTEFVQPTERNIRIVNGFHGIVNFGI